MTAHSGQIPAFGKGVLPPNMAEAEGFLDEVDDVSRLIEGLHSGKLSAEYVDKRIKEKDDYEKEVVEKEKKKEEDAEAKKYDNLPEEKKLEVKAKVSERESEDETMPGEGWDRVDRDTNERTNRRHREGSPRRSASP